MQAVQDSSCMDVSALQARARKARDEITKEKHELAALAWRFQQAQAMDKVTQRLMLAREQLEQKAISAADQGKSEVVLLRLSFQRCDLRKVVQEELHRSQGRQPDPYPKLRQLGPPSFRDIEKWLRDELKLKDIEGLCPLDWLVELDNWVGKRDKAGALTRWMHKRPAVPEALETLLRDCEERGLAPRLERYKQFEDEGIALIVRWKV